MPIDRRSLVQLIGLAPLLGFRSRVWLGLRAAADDEKADHTIRIGTGLVELAPEQIVSTTLYNGQFPGPLPPVQGRAASRWSISITTPTRRSCHWHGQMIPGDVDGAAEEGTPFIPAHGMRRIAFAPGPAGFRFYHTHIVAGADLSRGTTPARLDPSTSSLRTTGRL